MDDYFTIYESNDESQSWSGCFLPYCVLEHNFDYGQISINAEGDPNYEGKLYHRHPIS